MRSLAAALALCTTAAAAQDDPATITGNELYDICTGADDISIAFCAGYISGYIDGETLGVFMPLARASDDETPTDDLNELSDVLIGHCIPESASHQQLQDVAVQYLRDNPQTRHVSARFLVWRSFVAAFPC